MLWVSPTDAFGLQLTQTTTPEHQYLMSWETKSVGITILLTGVTYVTNVRS